MEAGRELDALVAEKVMGWRRVGKSYHTKPAHRPSLDHPGEWLDDYDAKGPHDFLIDPSSHLDDKRVAFCGCDSTADLPPYSTDISDAWLVVEKLRKTHCCIKVYSDHEYIYECTMIKDPNDPHEGRQGIYRQATTAPLAICLAALKAVGYQLDRKEPNP